jgi:3'(2'), 5'-bisphosphate nucleotidase
MLSQSIMEAPWVAVSGDYAGLAHAAHPAVAMMLYWFQLTRCVAMESLENLVPRLLELCHEAGTLICAHYHAPGADRFESKGDDSPLTRADLDSHACLQRGLLALEPSLPVLSEESSEEELAQRRDWSRFWLVDPLDGTKEFLARTGEFTINIALVDGHRPVLGLIYLPLEQVGYVGIPGSGAQCHHFEQGTWRSSPLSIRRLEEGRPLTVLASRRHRGPRLMACLDWLIEQWGPIERDDSGSALKFCQLAAGTGDFYPRFTPCCEWDTGAGQALVEAAGGCLLGLDGAPLGYNQGDSLLSPNFYAIADPGHPLWQRLLDRGPF